ncbi:MAG: DUF4114 domain-containing protein, partial [Bryobacteraceae bacterium]
MRTSLFAQTLKLLPITPSGFPSQPLRGIYPIRKSRFERTTIAILFAFAISALPLRAENLTLGATGRVSIELVSASASFSNTLLLVRTVGSTAKPAIVKPTGCKLEPPFDNDQTRPNPELLPILSEKVAQRGCRVTLDKDGSTSLIDGFNAGDTLEFKMCAQTNATPQCEALWSSDPKLNRDGFDHVMTKQLSSTAYPGRIYELGWEDSDNGGDLDFNDLIVVVRVELDSDGDGLWDDWETDGIDTDGDGIPDLKLPGANPLRKNLYLQIDYMGCSDASPNCSTGHRHKPDPNAIADVIAAFKNSPVSNPDGSTGIDLTIDVRTEVPHEDAIELDGLDRIKTKYFDNQRRFAYRYGIWAHGRSNSSSGVAEIFGNDLIVSLGLWTDFGTRKEQAGTLMHEFGHTLGLGHGGGDGVNNKPNYLSVMSYAYQFDHLPIRVDTFNGIRAENAPPDSTAFSSVLDYSRWALPLKWRNEKQDPAELDENNLDENVGLLFTDNDNSSGWQDRRRGAYQNYPRYTEVDGEKAIRTTYRASHYCPSGSWQVDDIGDGYVFLSAAGVSGIDWDCNGQTGASSTKLNINGEFLPMTLTRSDGTTQTVDDLTKP